MEIDKVGISNNGSYTGELKHFYLFTDVPFKLFRNDIYIICDGWETC